MIRSLAMFVVAAVATACTSTATIAEGVCGNDVLDPGEDCDQPGSACTAQCRVVCDPKAATGSDATCGSAIDGTCCPTDFACGQDGVCHQPTGTFTTSPLTLGYDVAGYVIADINGDGINDAFGIGTNAVNVLYGDLTMPFGSAFQTPAPTFTANAVVSFGDLDGDGRPDLLLPTAGGLFAFETTTGVPNPVEFPANTVAGITHERLATVPASLFLGTPRLIELDAIPDATTGTPEAMLSSISLLDLTTVVDAVHKPCNLTRAGTNPLHGRALHPVVDAVDNTTIHVPLEINAPGGSGAAVSVCVDSMNPKGTNASYVVSIPTGAFPSLGTLKEATSPGDGEVFFAPLVSPTSCPDLVVPVLFANGGVSSEAAVVIPASQSGSACGLDATKAFVPAFNGGTAVAGLPFAAAKLVGDAKVALVTSIGIETFDLPVGAAQTTVATLQTAAPRAWRYATVADINNDSRDDVIATGVGTGVDVLAQQPGIIIGGVTVAQWRDIMVATTLNPIVVEPGDFDGDGVPDLAIATTDPAVVGGPADLAIAWGSGTAYDLVPVGSFAEPDNLVVFNLADSTLPTGLDQYDDLIIARGGADITNANDPALLVAEYGSSSRDLNAPFVFRSTFTKDGSGKLFATAGLDVSTGNYGFGSGTNAFALFVPSQPDGVKVTSIPPTNTGELVGLTATSYGSFDVNPGFDVAVPLCDPVTNFCIDTARFLRFEGAGGDVLTLLRSDVPPAPIASAECAQYLLGGATSFAPAPLTCSQLVAADVDQTSNAFNALVGATTSKVLDTAAATGISHVLLASGSRAIDKGAGTEVMTFALYGWTVTLTAGVPVFSAPIDFDAELGLVVPAGAAAYCIDGANAQLGRRTGSDGTVYGADELDLALVCAVGTGTTYSTQVWGRFANPAAGGKPLYAELVDLEQDITAHIKAGDVNGDELHDLLLTYGNSFQNDVLLTTYFQCDTHQTSCVGGQ